MGKENQTNQNTSIQCGPPVFNQPQQQQAAVSL